MPIFTHKVRDYIELDMFAGDARQRITLSNIISQLDSHSLSKVLIEGGSGMGKSTTIDRLLYLSGEGHFEEFDHLLKIKLEFLLDKDWKADYGEYIRENPLACLAHYSLEQSVSGRGVLSQDYIRLEEIIELFQQTDQSRTMLLADGYDKIAHLMGNKAVKNIIGAILEFDNVIMTARPDTMISLTRDAFDLVIKTEGLSGVGMVSYVKNHFDIQSGILQDAIEAFFQDVRHVQKDIASFITSLRNASLRYEVSKIFNNQSEVVIKAIEAFFQDDRHVQKDINSFIASLGNNPLHYEVSKIFKDYSTSDKDEMISMTGAYYRSIQTMHDLEEIKSFISAYYQVTAKAIIDFARQNQIVQELLRSPMHATMICEVCSIANVQQRLSDALTLDELYRELMIKIGERFTEERDFLRELPEFLALKQLAHKGLTSESLSGAEVSEIAEKCGTDIDKLFSVGLLRIVGVEQKHKTFNHSTRRVDRGQVDSLIDKKFAFAHPSILAYLAASEAKNLLMLEKKSPIAKKEAEFIASHRDETQYHVFLKFLAGMVSGVEDRDKIAIIRFWDAVACELDETVETGTSGLVTLWMHLLSQATRDGVVDSRIPNLGAMVEIIDHQVLNNFLQWKKVIEASGYISDQILAFLEKQIDQQSRDIRPNSKSQYSANEVEVVSELMVENIELIIAQGDRDNKDVLDVLNELQTEDSEDELDLRLSNTRYQSISPEDIVAKAAIETVGNLAGKVDNSKIFSLLFTNLSIFQDHKILEAAIIAITKILKNRKLSYEDIESFKTKLDLFASHPAAVEALRVIDSYNSAGLIARSESQTLDGLTSSQELKMAESPLKKPPMIHEDTSLHRVLSTPLKDLIIQIKQNQESLEQVNYIKILIDNLATHAVWLADPWEVRMECLLEILGYSSDDSASYLAPQLKKLAGIVKKVIQIHIKMVNDNGNFEWICQNFKVLQKCAKAEFKMVMEYLFDQALSDNKISDQEGNVIAQCIDELDFSITIKPPKIIDEQVTYFVQYNGINYKLSGLSNAEQMKKIIEVALLHKKQFPVEIVNSGEGIMIAASDANIKCYSMVDEKLQLLDVKQMAIVLQNSELEDSDSDSDVKIKHHSTIQLPKNKVAADKALVSFLYLSDHTKASPKDALILVETRDDHFGRHVVYQISVIKGRVVVDEYRRHPENLDTAFRTSILGGMKYEGDPKTKTRYFTQTIETSLDEAYVILSKAESCEKIQDSLTQSQKKSSLSKNKIANRGDLKEDQMIAKIQLLYSLISTLVEQEDNEDRYQKITGDWRIDLNKFIVRDRTIIDAIDVYHTDSLIIGQRELEEQVQELNAFKNQINIDALVQVIEREELSASSKAEMDIIKADPYKLEVYTETVLRVRAFYTAVNAIYTEMVKNQARGAVGMTGDLLIKISSHFPFGLGLIVNFIGELFGAVDDEIAKDRIDNFIHFASAEDILIISDKIARKIVSHNLGEVSKMASDKAGKLAETAYNVVQTGPAALIIQACNKFREYIEKRGHEETKEDAAKVLGREHAEIISEIIVESIFTKSYAPKLIHGDFKARWKKFYKNEIEYKASAIAFKVSQELSLELTPEDIKFEAAASDDGREDFGNIDTGSPRVSSNVASANPKPPIGCTPGRCVIMTALDTPSPKIYFRDGQIEVEHVALSSNYFLQDEKGKDLLKQVELLYGEEALNEILEFGKDEAFVKQILRISEQDAKKIIDMFFGNEIAEPILRLKMINYFLQDENGRDLLQKVELIYGEEALNKMLELGNYQDIAEQILLEVETQGAEKVIALFFEDTANKAITNFAKITDNETSPGFYQYIYNALSSNKFSKSAIETIKYINYAYGRLEKMLNEGLSGNKVAIAITIIESLLSYAESGQFIMGYRPSPYGGPGDDNGGGPGGGNSGLYFEGTGDHDSDGEPVHMFLLEGIALNNTELAGIFRKIENLEYQDSSI